MAGMSLEVALTRIREVLSDADEAYVRQWLQEQQGQHGCITAESIEGFIADRFDDGSYPRAEVCIIWKSATEVARKLDIGTEVEERMERELRGEPAVVPVASPLRSNEYNLHAMHTLLVRFPKVPKPIIRNAFLKSGSFQAAAARLYSLDDYQELKRARKENAIPPPPVEVPIGLAREIAFTEEQINGALAARRMLRQQRMDEAKEAGDFYTCSCCFDDELLPEEAMLCDGEDSHAFCRSCVKNHALSFFGGGLFAQNFQEACRASCSVRRSSEAGASSSSSFSSSQLIDLTTVGSDAPARRLDLQQAVLRCPAMSACVGRFRDPDLRLAMPVKDFKRYTSRAAALHALASGLSDLVPCPSCEFIVEMNDHADGVIRCLNPECGRQSCRWCGEPDHQPLRCDQVEKDAEVKLRTYMEEQMTNALARRCPNPQCHKVYERTEGCNKMSCPCGTFFCYLCGQVLDKNRPYDHYGDGQLGGGKPDKKSKCIVYGTPAWAQPSANASRDRAEKALQEYLQLHPELQDLGGERIKKIRRTIGLEDEPTPAHAAKRRKVSLPNQNVWNMLDLSGLRGRLPQPQQVMPKDLWPLAIVTICLLLEVVRSST